MKAAVIDSYGAAENLRIRDLPMPSVRPSDVLVRVHATSVNPVDTKQRLGIHRLVVRKAMPAILGMDLSGVVEAVGVDVHRFQPGDEVWSSPSHRRPGTWAEFVSVYEGELALKPSSLSHIEAASLPLVGLTAWACLMEGPPVTPGQRVLVQAGSGGVGTVGIQLAKHLQAHVSTTCSARNEELVRGLGADEVVDYQTRNYWEVLPRQHHVLESIGPSMWRHSMDVLERGGHLASIASGMPAAVKRWGPTFGPIALAWGMAGALARGRREGLKVRHVIRKASGEQLGQLAELANAGTIRPVVERVLPLAGIVEANRLVESGRTRGKVVVELIS